MLGSSLQVASAIFSSVRMLPNPDDRSFVDSKFNLKPSKHMRSLTNMQSVGTTQRVISNQPVFHFCIS